MLYISCKGNKNTNQENAQTLLQQSVIPNDTVIIDNDHLIKKMILQDDHLFNLIEL